MIVLAILLTLLGWGTASAQDSSAALRRDFAEMRGDGLSDDEANALAERGFALGRAASDTRELCNALSAVAAICAESSPAVAAWIRDTALGLLAASFHDSQRWSTLLVEGFLPRVDALPAADGLAELERYETRFDELARGTMVGESAHRLRAELEWARAYARVDLDRRKDWLTDGQREEALARLDSLVARFGTLPIPGSRGEDAFTVGERARRASDEMRSLAFGATAPVTKGVDLDGNAIDLAAFRGRVVVLDFWTSFCAPCLAMVPHTRTMLDRLAGEPVTFLGVCGDESQEKGRRTAARVDMRWPSLWDDPGGANGPLAKTWHVTGWPTLFVLDGEGRIRFKFRTPEQAEAGLEAAVRSLLPERASP